MSVAKTQNKVHAAAVRCVQIGRWLEDTVLEGDVDEILDAEERGLAVLGAYEAALNELHRARLLVNAKQRRKRSRWTAEKRERINAQKRAVRAVRRASS